MTDERYQRLASSPPNQRQRIVLELIAGKGEEPLDLGSVDGQAACLDEVDLDRQSLQKLAEAERRAADGAAPAWWDEQAQGAALQRVRLRGASLRSAKLRGASIEAGDLREADLAGADLRDAVLGNADMRGTLLEEADLGGASLRFADLRAAALDGARLQGADLWGANLENASLAGADLQSVTLQDANLRRADLSRTDLRGARLTNADLHGANLTGAQFQGAVLGGTILREAVLKDARLEGMVLLECDVRRAHVGGAWLDHTRVRQEQFGGAIGEEVAGDFPGARDGYLALELNFAGLGDSDAASWAYRKRRRMQKQVALQKAESAWKAGERAAAARAYAEFVTGEFVEWLCDYGESIPRVLRAMLLVFLLFTFAYGVDGSVVRAASAGGNGPAVTRDPVDLAIFSLMAMTTSGNPAVDLLPRDVYVHALSGIQALLGIFLTGLLGFVVGNRVRR